MIISWRSRGVAQLFAHEPRHGDWRPGGAGRGAMARQVGEAERDELGDVKEGLYAEATAESVRSEPQAR